MPLYVYRCTTCDNVDEVLLGRALETVSCSQCHGMSVKQMTAPAVVKVEGSFNTPRGRWMRDWTPQSPKFKVGSHHGEAY